VLFLRLPHRPAALTHPRVHDWCLVGRPCRCEFRQAVGAWLSPLSMFFPASPGAASGPEILESVLGVILVLPLARVSAGSAGPKATLMG
jgi:hypothetical protein